MKRALLFLTGATCCAPVAFGAPVNGLTILGLALIATAVTIQFAIERHHS